MECCQIHGTIRGASREGVQGREIANHESEDMKNNVGAHSPMTVRALTCRAATFRGVSIRVTLEGKLLSYRNFASLSGGK